MAAAAIPLAIAAAGTVASEAGQRQQARQQRNDINQALARTDKTQTQSNSMITAEASKLAAPQRMQTMQAQTDANVDQSKADLAASGATDANGNAIIDTAGDNGAVSKDFLTAKADRALSEGTRLSTIARQLAATRAPGQVVGDEAQRRAGLTEQIGSDWGSTKALNEGNTLDAQNRQLPGYAKLGKLAQIAALAYMTGGAGAGAAGGTAGAGTIWAGGDGAASAAGAFA